MNVKAAVALAVLAVSTVGVSACGSAASAPGVAAPPAASVTSPKAHAVSPTHAASPSTSAATSTGAASSSATDAQSSAPASSSQSTVSSTHTGSEPSQPDSSSASDDQSSGSGSAKCWYGSCFSYVTGRQYTDTTGASVKMSQAVPSNVAADGHSLQELSLQSSDDTTTANTIEVGWSVDNGINGDYQPHLFVYHWIKGQRTCYNGCGFVQVSSSVTAGMAVTPGATGTFGLRYHQGNWWASYNGVDFGYFPEAEWGGSFTDAQVVSAFGEVASDKAPSCTQMGNGVFGSRSGASSISDYQLIGSADQPDFQVWSTDPGSYNDGSVTATSFTLGGPGKC